MNKNTIIILIVVILAILGGYYIFSQSGPNPISNLNSNPTPASEPTPVTPTTPVNQAKTDEFVINGANYSFTPNALTVKKGDIVMITFKNTGGFHDFHIDEFNIATTKLQGGQEATVQFVADKTGSFQYYCAVGSHRAMGMWGTLTVTE